MDPNKKRKRGDAGSASKPEDENKRQDKKTNGQKDKLDKKTKR